MKTVYKKPRSNADQVSYLEQNKRVTFTNINKEEAEKLLYEHCYINLITPFKHRFADIDPSTGTPKRDAKNNHIYSKDTEFSEYYSAYSAERDLYPIIYKNIMSFESIFNSIVAEEVLMYYQIDSFANFLDFRNDLMLNASNLKISDQLREHLQDDINSFYQTMKKYDDIYIFLDRLSLSSLITVYKCCNKQVHNKIFQGLISCNATFGYSSPGTFDDILKRIVPIRNCICHFNSLEILINYYNIKTKELRKLSDRKRYINVIKKLSL